MPRLGFTAAVVLLLSASARADGPLVVELPERATARTSLVTLGDVAKVTGGSAAERARAAALDLAEVKARDPSLTLTKRSVEFRLKLAGLTGTVGGAERTAVALVRRTVTPDEVVPAARAELLKQLPFPGTAELAVPVAVRLPDIPAGEQLAVAAKLHAPVTRAGRAQVDVTLAAGGEQLLAFAVHFEVRGAGEPAVTATTPAAAVPTGPAVVRQRQRVTMTARTGGLVVTAAGEAQQDGRVGEVIRVANVDSQKVVRARVTGPGTVDIDLGGMP